MPNETFEVSPVLDSGTGKYVVANYEKNKAIVDKFVSECLSATVEVHDDNALKLAKTNRTAIRKHNETISSARKDINALLLGEFNVQLKEIENVLKSADVELKSRIDKYEEEVKGKVEKQRVLTLTIKGLDMKVLEKLRDNALSLGLKAEIK